MAKQSFRGELYVGSGTAACPVSIYFDCGQLRFVKDSGECLEAHYGSLKFALGGFEGLQLEVSAVSAASEPLICYVAPKDKSAFLRSCLMCGHGIDRASVERVIRAEKKGRFAFLAPLYTLAAAAVVLIAAFFLSAKAFSGRIVEYVPAEYEAKIGEIAAKKLVAGKQLITSGPLYEAVSSVLNQVLSGIENNPYKFKLYLVSDSIINAMATPGGHVVVFTGLLKNVESTEELAGILAHECAHVMHRHSLRAILNNTLTLGMAAALLSGIGVDEVFVEIAASAMQNAHSRDDEREADSSGVKFLIKANINPAKFLDFFDRLEKNSGFFDGALAILSTHPSSKERTERLKKLIGSNAEKNETYPKIKPEWREIRGLLKGL